MIKHYRCSDNNRNRIPKLQREVVTTTWSHVTCWFWVYLYTTIYSMVGWVGVYNIQCDVPNY